MLDKATERSFEVDKTDFTLWRGTDQKTTLEKERVRRLCGTKGGLSLSLPLIPSSLSLPHPSSLVPALFLSNRSVILSLCLISYSLRAEYDLPTTGGQSVCVCVCVQAYKPVCVCVCDKYTTVLWLAFVSFYLSSLLLDLSFCPPVYPRTPMMR